MTEKEIPFVSYGEVGECGDDVYWFLTDGVLTIDGSGQMDDYTSAKEASWYGKEFTSCIIEENVYYIGAYAFAGKEDLVEINFPDNLISIGTYAFAFCESLTTINYKGAQTQWSAITKADYWDLNTPENKVINYNYAG